MKLAHLISPLLAFSLFFATTSVRAEDFKIVVSPPLTDVTGSPKEVIQKTIKVTNNSSSEIILKAVTSDFLVQDDLGTPVKVTENTAGKYFASPWFTLTSDTLNLQPSETKEIIVLITIPEDALPGGHYAGIFFSPTKSTAIDSTGAVITPEVGSLFAITVPGDLDYDATVTSFTTPSTLFEFGPINFTATIENHSDTHITPQSVIEIRDMLGRSLSTIQLSSVNIFPFTARELTATWDNVWGFGRYTATLTVPYGPSYATTRVLSFWILPYRLIAAVLTLILVIIAIIILIRRRRHHLSDTRDAEIDALKRRLVELENRR